MFRFLRRAYRESRAVVEWSGSSPAGAWICAVSPSKPLRGNEMTLLRYGPEERPGLPDSSDGLPQFPSSKLTSQSRPLAKEAARSYTLRMRRWTSWTAVYGNNKHLRNYHRSLCLVVGQLQRLRPSKCALPPRDCDGVLYENNEVSRY